MGVHLLNVELLQLLTPIKTCFRNSPIKEQTLSGVLSSQVSVEISYTKSALTSQRFESMPIFCAMAYIFLNKLILY